MPWTKPLCGKTKVDAAGDIIAGRKQATEEITLDKALDIAGNWRSSHGYPLHVVWTSLRNRPEKWTPIHLFQRDLNDCPPLPLN